MPNTHAALLAFLLSSGLACSALAQSQQRVVLFKTAAEDESLSELAAALDPVLSSELAEITTVHVTARAAVDLASMQLAIDCVGETIDCLRAAASQSEAESVLAPAVQHFEDGVQVTLLHFDATQEQPIRTIERRYTGERQGEQALTGLEGMVHELFGDPASWRAPAETIAPAEPTPPTAAPAPEPAVKDEPPAEAGVPILPIVIGGIGVALIGTGVAFGVMSQSSMDDFKGIRTSNTPDYTEAIRKADAKFDTANSQATIATVMFAVGAGALIGAGVLMFWQLKERPAESEVSVRPSVGPREAGLTLTAAWNDSL